MWKTLSARTLTFRIARSITRALSFHSFSLKDALIPQSGSGSDSTLTHHQYPDVQRLQQQQAFSASARQAIRCEPSPPLSPLEDEPVPDRRLPRDSTSESLERALRHTLPRAIDGASAGSERSLPPMSHGATLPTGSGAGSSLIFSANLKKQRNNKLGSLSRIFGGKSGSRDKGLRGTRGNESTCSCFQEKLAK